jgi:multiple sugar transport system permease protein
VAIAHQNFLRFFANTVLISCVSTVFIVLTSVVAGYVFAKQNFPFRDLLFGLVLITAIFPFETYMLPVYDLAVRLHWANTYQGILFPYVIMSFGIFLMRQTIGSSIPDDLLDMARIDGCGEWRILFRIVVPLSISAMSALAIFAFIQAWTLFIWPLLVVGTPSMYTMELALATFQRQFTLEYNLLMAGSVINVLPLLVVFALLRQQIMEGIAFTGMKN